MTYILGRKGFKVWGRDNAPHSGRLRLLGSPSKQEAARNPKLERSIQFLRALLPAHPNL